VAERQERGGVVVRGTSWPNTPNGSSHGLGTGEGHSQQARTSAWGPAEGARHAVLAYSAADRVTARGSREGGAHQSHASRSSRKHLAASDDMSAPISTFHQARRCIGEMVFKIEALCQAQPGPQPNEPLRPSCRKTNATDGRLDGSAAAPEARSDHGWLFNECEWTQDRIAKRMGKAQQWGISSVACRTARGWPGWAMVTALASSPRPGAMVTTGTAGN
jgi:hypothetical protein